MKKVLLAVLIIVLCASPMVFAACSNVSQRDLLTTGYVCSDDGYEYFSYDVYQKDGEQKTLVGEMTMKFEPKKAVDVTLPSATEEAGQKTFASFSLGRRLRRLPCHPLLRSHPSRHDADPVSRRRLLDDGNHLIRFTPVQAMAGLLEQQAFQLADRRLLDRR